MSEDQNRPRSYPSYLSPVLSSIQFTPRGWFPRWMHPWVWAVPYLRIKRSLMEPVVTERIVDIPFFWTRLGLPPGSKIFEFGCTDSPLALQLASLGYQVTAADLRPYGFEHPNLRLLIGNFLDQDLSNDSFDLVVAISSVEHCGLGAYGAQPIPEGDLRAVRRFLDILKPGAPLILTVPFGLKGQNEGQRTYDGPALDRLLQGFERLEEVYYVASGLRQWLPTNREGLAAVDSHTGRTSGVVMVRCRKPSGAR